MPVLFREEVQAMLHGEEVMQHLFDDERRLLDEAMKPLLSLQVLINDPQRRLLAASVEYLNKCAEPNKHRTSICGYLQLVKGWIEKLQEDFGKHQEIAKPKLGIIKAPPEIISPEEFAKRFPLSAGD